MICAVFAMAFTVFNVLLMYAIRTLPLTILTVKKHQAHLLHLAILNEVLHLMSYLVIPRYSL